MSAPDRSRFRGSAVVVLVRGQGEDLEVFWVTRSDAVPHFPGFQAFIGGTVDPQDTALPVAGAADEPDRVLRACAIRETFEETGVLVGATASVTDSSAALEEARRRLLAGEVRFPDLAREHGWSFRAGALTYAGRWQTPPFAVVRFDSVFYLARLPEGQTASVRVGELASGEWIHPLAALDLWHEGRATFASPVLHTLLTLAGGEEGLEERLSEAPELAAYPVRRIELKWGIVLHPMHTRPLPPATHTNTYLIGEREMAIVDPGSGDPEELEPLVTLIETLRAEGRRPRLILLTHHHPDHVGGVEPLRRRYHLPVAAHAATAEHLPVDLPLEDGEIIPLSRGLGSWDLRVLHTPGHARGHLCFLHERTRSLFCGDLISGGKGSVIIDPPEGDMAHYLASLERVLEAGVEALFPAHGSPQGGAARRIRGLRDHRLEREAKVVAALGDEFEELPALVERAYADTPQELWAYAERSLLAHLLKLEADGRARREGDRWRRA